MSDLDTEEPVSNLSDSSFVILGQGSLPSNVNEEISRTPTLNITTNNNSTLSDESSKATINGSLGGSIFSEESIQKKLNELVKENYELKETLSQNNLAIKSQLDTFFMWQQEVLKTHQTHKQKFLETKDLILKLQAENRGLKKQLQESVITASSVNAAEIYSQINKKPEKFEKTKEHEKLNYALIKENEMLKVEIHKLSEELKAAKIEILKLTNKLEDLGSDNIYLKQRSSEFNKDSLNNTSHNSLPNSEARAQISNLLRQLDEEKSKVLKLKEELKKIKFSNTDASGAKLSTTEELNQYVENLNEMNVSLKKQNQRFSSLQSLVSLAEETMNGNKIQAAVESNLVYEINELKTHLNWEENVSREKQETLQELRNKFTVLLDDYKDLQQKLNAMNNKDKNIEKYKEEIYRLSTELEAKDNELKLKLQECSYLKKENEKLNLKCKEVAILRTQVEMCRCDFNKEEEKENKAEEVRHKRNNQKEKNDSGAHKLETPGSNNRYTCSQCMVVLDAADFGKHIRECSDNHSCS